MKLKKILHGAIIINLVSSMANCVFAPTNFFTPYDPNLQLPKCPKAPLHIGLTAEYGQSNSVRNWEGDKHNVLKIYNQYEDAATMFKNPSSKIKDKVTTEFNRFYGAWGGQIVHAPISFEGEFSLLDLTLFGKYRLKNLLEGDFVISLYMPIRWQKIEDVKFEDLSEKYLPIVPEYYKQNYTKNFSTFKSKFAELGGADLSDWDKSGIGDLVAMFEWQKSFKQNKEALQNVDLYLKLGLSIPTAEKRNVDKAFSMSLGNDGAWGLPLGAGLALDFNHSIRLGGDVEFLVLFDETHERRLKTDPSQTEFLLLNKGNATLDHGLTWKFNVYLQAYRFYKGLSLKLAYEYIKHDEDKLYEKTDTFDRVIINTANSLKEWNSHNLIFQLNLDFFIWKRVFSKPQFSLFFKLPLTGKNVINVDTFGGQIGFNF